MATGRNHADSLQQSCRISNQRHLAVQRCHLALLGLSGEQIDALTTHENPFEKDVEHPSLGNAWRRGAWQRKTTTPPNRDDDNALHLDYPTASREHGRSEQRFNQNASRHLPRTICLRAASTLGSAQHLPLCRGLRLSKIRQPAPFLKEEDGRAPNINPSAKQRTTQWPSVTSGPLGRFVCYSAEPEVGSASDSTNPSAAGSPSNSARTVARASSVSASQVRTAPSYWVLP